MAALRPSIKLASAVGVGVAGGYVAAQSFKYTAHAESMPSDAKAALKKADFGKFTELKVLSTEQYNHNVKRITFALPTEDTVSGLSPITSLLTRHTPEGAWIPVFRPYTPVSDNDVPGTVTFMVKKYPGGKGSSKMHSLQPGESLLFKSLQEFEYKPNQYESMLLIAGGSGITPLYQLTRAILRNPADKTKISLVYANNTEEDILLKKEFEDLEKQYPGRFQKVFTVSKKSSDDDSIQTGYVTKEMLAKIWPGKQGSQKVCVSGPPSMIEAVAGAKSFWGWRQGNIGGILSQLGYSSEDVHKF